MGVLTGGISVPLPPPGPLREPGWQRQWDVGTGRFTGQRTWWAWVWHAIWAPSSSSCQPTHIFFIVSSLDLGNLGVRTSLQPHPGSSKALWVRDHGYWLPWVTKVTRVLGYNHSTYLWSWGSLLCSSVSTGHVCTGHGTRAFGSTWQNLLDRGRTPTVLKGWGPGWAASGPHPFLWALTPRVTARVPAPTPRTGGGQNPFLWLQFRFWWLPSLGPILWHR